MRISDWSSDVCSSDLCQRLGRFDVTLRNVSLTGIGGQGPHALQIGERMTVIMPGHEPMLGTVRWVAGTCFGIQTDREIETMRLRAAHKDQIVDADSKADFQIISPPRVDPWRTGLTRGPQRQFGLKRYGLATAIKGRTGRTP